MYCAIANQECKKELCMFWIPAVFREEIENEHCVLVRGILSLNQGLTVYTTDV